MLLLKKISQHITRNGRKAVLIANISILKNVSINFKKPIKVNQIIFRDLFNYEQVE